MCLCSPCCSGRAPTGQYKHPGGLSARRGTDASQGTGKQRLPAPRFMPGRPWTVGKGCRADIHQAPSTATRHSWTMALRGLLCSVYKLSLGVVQAQLRGKPSTWLPGNCLVCVLCL